MEVCPIGTTRRLFQVACRDGILPIIPAIWQENFLSLGNFLIKYSQKIQKDVIILFKILKRIGYRVFKTFNKWWVNSHLLIAATDGCSHCNLTTQFDNEAMIGFAILRI